MPSLKTNKMELLIIAGLLAAAFAAWGLYAVLGALRHSGGAGRVYAEIVYEGKVVERVYLDEERRFSVSELPNVVFEVKNRKIAFVQSDCPDKVCVRTGWLEAGGHSAACLPNRALLRVVEERGGVDAVAR